MHPVPSAPTEGPQLIAYADRLGGSLKGLTHDGIGVADVGPSGAPGRDDGLLDDRARRGDPHQQRRSQPEVGAALSTHLVRAQLAALRLRSRHPAFRGHFSHTLDGPRLVLCWRSGEHRALLVLDASTGQPSVEATDQAGASHVVGTGELAAQADLTTCATGQDTSARPWAAPGGAGRGPWAAP